jgi:hypothetical protein
VTAAPRAARRAPAATAPRRFGDAPALAVLLGITALVAWNRFAFDTWLTRFDLYTFFLPWYAFLGERLRALDIPGWNPHLFSGAPFAGDPESGWMYLPAMLTFALLSATAAFKAMVALQLLIAALSTFAFARVLGMGVLASLVAATAYVVGPFLHWNTYCCLIFAQFATWIPLALLGIELALRAATWRQRVVPWLLGGLAVSQMLGGWIGEGWFYAILLPAAYIAYRMVEGVALRSGSGGGDAALRGEQWDDAGGRATPVSSFLAVSPSRRLTVSVITAVAILGSGLALAAAGILPRIAVNAETNLAGGDYGTMGDAGVLNPPWELDYLLAQTLGTGSGYHFRAAALGGAVVVLALLAPVLARRRFAVPFFAGLTLVAMVLTLETTSLHQLFYLIPRYRELHEHDAWRSMALAAIGPALLAGATIAALPSWRGRRAMLPVVFVPLLFLLVVDLILRRTGLALGWTALAAAVVTTHLVAAAIVIPLDRHPTAGQFARLVPALALGVIFVFPTGLELLGSWLGWPPHPEWERHWRADPAQTAALRKEIRATDPDGAGAFLQEQLATSGPFRYAGYGGVLYPGDEMRQESYMGRRFDPNVRAILVNGRPIYLGLYDVQGYNPLHLARYDDFMTALNGAPQDYHTAFLLASGLRSPLLDLLHVRYLVLDTALPPERDDVVELTAGAREVFRTRRAIVYERDATRPHAWIVHDVRPVAAGEALPLLTSGAIDPYQTALVEGSPPETAVPEASSTESARVTRYEPDRLTIATESAAPGLLVLSEIYASGWRAIVDGAEVPVLPTDHALRGVPLPAGEHTVELLYDPLSLRVGVGISGLAAMATIAVFAAAGWSRWSRRDRQVVSAEA